MQQPPCLTGRTDAVYWGSGKHGRRKNLALTPSFDAEQDAQIRSPLHETLLGTSPAIQQVRELIERLAPSDLIVLIVGESGTGKDIAARALHRKSSRAGKPFIKVNCPAIPEGILESELFGYERGAFTGARTSKPGRFELAHMGVLFLDEVAETSPAIQGKLLQALDGEPIMRVGGVQPYEADVRIIAATNMSLEDAVRDGRMREDIYFRLSEVVIHMPPLRERPEDIAPIAEHFNYNFCERFGKDYRPLASEVLAKMEGLEWRGNVRELGARLKKYVATGNPDLLATEYDDPAPQVAEPVREEPPPEPVAVPADPEPEHQTAPKRFVPLKEAARRAVEQTEKALILEALQHTLWNRRKAARLLDISYSSLLRRIAAYNIGEEE
jgi:two-component system, NtrC family, response regulator AtoC